MIRALTNATHFAAGFVCELVRHGCRIALWTASVAILGALAASTCLEPCFTP
jgi:hypothetical protein